MHPPPHILVQAAALLVIAELTQVVGDVVCGPLTGDRREVLADALAVGEQAAASQSVPGQPVPVWSLQL